MPFQYTWELDLSGEGTLMPSFAEQVVVGPSQYYLFDLSPHYYIPNVDITVTSGLDGYYDYTISGAETPVGVSIYFPNNSEVTWSIGLYSDVPISGLRVYQDKYGELVTGDHGGTGWEFFSFNPLRTNYRDIWVIESSPKVGTDVTFRSANKYHVTASGKYDGIALIPTEASGNPLTSLTCMNNISPTDWSSYHHYYFDYYREPTVSGTSGSLILDLDIQPHHDRVYGGSVSCSGSHPVNWLWQKTLDNVSGTLGLASYLNSPISYTLQTKTIGDAIGINPNKIKYGLIAWHPLQSGPIYEDRSGNETHASGIGNLNPVLGKHGYGAGLGSYPYGYINAPLEQQSQDYMVSFWFKPNQLLTSGTDTNFVIMDSDDFYGDHFRDSFDYLVYPRFKGWERLGFDTVTCSAGFESDYLRLKGAPETDWFGSKWDSTTLWFPIPKERDWSVETKFKIAGQVGIGQKAGFIFFNESSYFDYCSLVLQGDTPDEVEYQYIESSIPYMTSQTSPSPYRVDCDDYYQNNSNYHAWKAFDGVWDASYYYHSNEGLPCWVRLDTGADSTKVIQGYRLRRRHVHFPRDWQFQGADSTSGPWTTLHTMVNQPDLANGDWTSWFYFSNETPYRYYRFYITTTRGYNYATWDGTEFYVKDKVALTTDANIKVQTQDLSYTIEDHASVSGTWIFQMHKRGDYVWFGYREDSDDTMGIITPIYRMDVSLWGDDMRLGLQSSNPLSDAPEVIYDYFRFQRGMMPEGLGDPEEPGRFRIAYNQADAQEIVSDRTDSRLWLMTSRSGIAYGTARFRWEPDEWYLIQAGVKPNAVPANINEDFCWWVNVRQDQGETVGSGIGPEVFLVSGTGLNYFDPEPYTTSSGMFKLDEVSHWNRWLKAEEILKMWNRVSQVSWHATEPYLEDSENLLTIDTTNSGFETLLTVPKTTEFEYFTHYQSPLPPQITLQLEKISYRIQKNLSIAAWQLEPKEISILRMSSGWISGNSNCYCMEEFKAEEDWVRPVSAEADKIYSSEIPMDLFDGDANTYYRSGASPPVSLVLHYGREVTIAAFRFRAFNNSTYWDDDFPSDIKLYGSNDESASLTSEEEWTYLFDLSVPLPAANWEWCDWVEFPNPVTYWHFKVYIEDNYGAGNWISLAEMELRTGNMVPTIYGLMDVRGDVAVFTRAFDYPTFDLLEITVPRQVTFDVPQVTVSGEASSQYTTKMTDITEPRISYASPPQNSRMVHPEFLWLPYPTMYLDVTEFGGVMDFDRNRVWMLREGGFYYPYQVNDNFSFYSWDPGSITPSGYVSTSGVDIWDSAVSSHGWSAINYGSAIEFTVNSGYNSWITTSGHGSDSYNVYDPNGLDDSLVSFEVESRDNDAQCFVGGSRRLRITTSGSSAWHEAEQSAPFMYFTMPSGVVDWEISTRLTNSSYGPGAGQYAGIMISDPGDPASCVKLLLSDGDLYALNSLSGEIPAKMRSTSLGNGEPVFLKMAKDELNLITMSWSSDGEVWEEMSSYTLGPEYDATPPVAMTDYWEGNFHVWASSELSYQEAYKAFDKAFAWGGVGGDNYKTRWKSSGNVPQWIAMDFGEDVVLTSYKMRGPARSTTWGEYMCTPRGWLVQGSHDASAWTTIGSETDAVCQGNNVKIPSEHELEKFYVESPGKYRYYRFYITQGWYLTSPYRVSIGEIFLWASPAYPTTMSGTLNAGLTVMSDSTAVFGRRGTEEGNPVLTSNNSPDPYVVNSSYNSDATHPAWHAVDSSGSTSWRILAGQVHGPQWWSIDLGAPKRVMGYRYKVYTSNGYSGLPQASRLQGSDNGNAWVNLDYREDVQATTNAAGAVWCPYSDQHYLLEETAEYRYYRLYIPYTFSQITSYLYDFKFLFDISNSGGAVSEFEGTTVADFDWVRVADSAGEISEQVSIGDDWELLLDGEEVHNSEHKSGAVFYSQLDTNKFRISYTPQEGFGNGERVFVRVEAHDTPGLKIDYDGYDTDPSVQLFVKGHGPAGVLADTRVAAVSGTWLHDTGGDHAPFVPPTVTGTEAAEMYVSFRISKEETYDYHLRVDDSLYDRDLHGGSSTVFTGEEVHIGPTSLYFTGNVGISTADSTITSGVINGDWTLHGWFNFRQVPSYGSLLTVSDEVSNTIFDIQLDTNLLRFKKDGQIEGEINLGENIPVDEWIHVAVTKKDEWINAFWNGVRLKDYVKWEGFISTSSGVGLSWGQNTNSYCNYYAFEEGVKWDSSFVEDNVLDEIYSFKVASWKDLGVDVTTVADEEPPVHAPISPLPNASGVCPASGIKFDILDDYSGVNWDNLVVTVDDITVYSGGNNMTVWYPDRGTLVIEDRGNIDGEWNRDFPQGASGTEIITDGVNRLLYPPGTVYSGSGAWGKRFTYYVDEDTQIEFFDYHMNITVTGTDNRGYLSQFDAIETNSFGYEYSFDFITNDNIKMGNFFMDVGESERVDVMQAKGRHIWVDLWDTDYPTTDIDESESYLRFYDGVLDFVCSGTWWTTYTGTAGTTSGVRIHRLHYDAGDYYWDGHRTMHWEVHAQNDNPMCGVYNRDEYQLLYGWHLFWLHHDRIPPFEFDKKLPVFVSIKTQDYVPSRYSKSYMIWTAPAGTHDFNVGLKALPLGAGNELEVDILAHSHYLQYSEDVDVELYCKDRDGNELLYTWTFTTEDEPEN